MAEITPLYLNNSYSASLKGKIVFEESQKPFQIKEISIRNSIGAIIEKPIPSEEVFFVEIDYLFKEEVKKCNLTLIIQNASGETVWFLDRTDFYNEFFVADIGKYKTRIKIPNPLLKPGQYLLTVGLSDAQSNVDDHKFTVLKFEVDAIQSLRSNRQGHLFLPTLWEMIKDV
jgi:lipopolysaccharide transport system ATP-binding protein